MVDAILTDEQIKKMAESLNDSSLPGNEATRAIYKKNWKNFADYCKIQHFPDPNSTEPSEDIWKLYFAHMVKEKKYKAAWSLYSSLSTMFLKNWGYVAESID